MHFVSNGIRYHVDIWGEGFPLLLLHGFTGNGEGWREFMPYWKTHSKAIAPDIIGHGKTDSPEDTTCYRIEKAAQDLNQLLDKLGIEKVDLLGYSMGGRLALTFAVKYPEKVRKLILESTSPGLETEGERKARQMQDAKLALLIKEHGVPSFVEYWENIPLFQSQNNLPEGVQNSIRNQRLTNNQMGLMNSLYGMGTGAQPSWWDELESIQAPTLLITGSLDEKFCRIAKKMAERLKNCKCISISDSGHAIHVEKPKIFGTIVSEFLTQVEFDYI